MDTNEQRKAIAITYGESLTRWRVYYGTSGPEFASSGFHSKMDAEVEARLLHSHWNYAFVSNPEEYESVASARDYLNDLNAMHEAENIILTQSRASAFWTHLYSICVRDKNPGWHATAAQRAEAFLRTIGKWTE